MIYFEPIFMIGTIEFWFVFKNRAVSGWSLVDIGIFLATFLRLEYPVFLNYSK